MSIGAPPTGTPQAMTTPGSLTGLMDGLEALQASINDHPLIQALGMPLTCYRWQPLTPDLPALWNWMLPSTAEQKDMTRKRDLVNIATRIGTRATDVEDHMPIVEAAADAYRALVDVSYWNGSTIPAATKGWTTWAERTQMGMFGAEIGGIPVVGIEFQQVFWTDRRLA